MNAPVGRRGRPSKSTAKLIEAIEELTRAQVDWTYADLAVRVGLPVGSVISAVLRLRAYGVLAEVSTMVLKPKIVVVKTSAAAGEAP